MTSTEQPSESIARSYARCASVVRSRARNFYYGLRLTPEPKRSAIYAVYAWMRRADDEADAAAAPAVKRERLRAFRETTESVINGEAAPPGEGEFIWTAIGDATRRFSIDPINLRTMLDGLDTDIDHEALAAARPDRQPIMFCRDRADLERYCFRVASTVGLVCVTIWGLKAGVDPEAARRLAVQRGLAFQLTNILRDFGQDYDEGRVYLSADDFSAAGLAPSTLRAWSDPDRCEQLVNEISAWARLQYAESAPLDRMIDPTCYATLRTMTRIYSGLLSVIENDPARIAGRKRIRLQSLHKAGIALRACARAWVNVHIPASSPLHAVLTPAGRR